MLFQVYTMEGSKFSNQKDKNHHGRQKTKRILLKDSEDCVQESVLPYDSGKSFTFSGL